MDDDENVYMKIPLHLHRHFTVPQCLGEIDRHYSALTCQRFSGQNKNK